MKAETPYISSYQGQVNNRQPMLWLKFARLVDCIASSGSFILCHWFLSSEVVSWQKIYCRLVSPQDKTRHFTLPWITQTDPFSSPIYLLSVLFGDRTAYVTSGNLFHLEVGEVTVSCIDYVTTHCRHTTESIRKETAHFFLWMTEGFLLSVLSAHVVTSMYLHSYTKWHGFVCVFVHISGAANPIATRIITLSYLRISTRMPCGSDYLKRTVAMDLFTCNCASVGIVTLSFPVKFISVCSKLKKKQNALIEIQ